MTKRMMADVFWDAANEHLRAAPRVRYEFDGNGVHLSEYSCDAVGFAVGMFSVRRNNESLYQYETAKAVLRTLGCPGGMLAFDDTPAEKRQGVRYMWLLIAMHVAEDEGLTL